jgi:hypothetical protein
MDKRSMEMRGGSDRNITIIPSIFLLNVQAQEKLERMSSTYRKKIRAETIK